MSDEPTLSPAKQHLLLDIVNIQDKMLDAIEQIFSGLRQSSDAEVVSISEEAIAAIRQNQRIAIAMTERLTATIN